MEKVQPKPYVQRESDRRVNEDTVQFPLLDSEFNIVREDRRRIPDRRKANLKLIWQENQPIRHTNELSLEIDGESYYFDSSLDVFTFGRSLQSDVRFDNQYVSKDHAHIKYRNGEFVLQDTSLNGTFVETEELGKIRLQGRKVYLSGSGKISLGTPIDREDQQLIYFNCI